MSKKHIFKNERKLGRFHRGREWVKVNAVFKDEIIPNLEIIYDPNTRSMTRQALINYLVIRLISIIESFFSNRVRRMIDEHQVTDISKLVDTAELDSLTDSVYTKGKLFASSFDFANYKEIQRVMSSMLNIDFFGVVKALDKNDPYREIKKKRTILLYKNWDNFFKIFELRTDIVHGLKNAELSNRQIATLCDNTINMLDAASWISHPDFFRYETNFVTRLGLWRSS